MPVSFTEARRAGRWPCARSNSCYRCRSMALPGNLPSLLQAARCVGAAWKSWPPNRFGGQLLPELAIRQKHAPEKTVARHQMCVHGFPAAGQFFFPFVGLGASVVRYEFVMHTRPAVVLDRNGTLTV